MPPRSSALRPPADSWPAGVTNRTDPSHTPPHATADSCISLKALRSNRLLFILWCDGVGPHPSFTFVLDDRFEEADFHCSGVPGDGVSFEADRFGGISDPDVDAARFREDTFRVVVEVHFDGREEHGFLTHGPVVEPLVDVCGTVPLVLTHAINDRTYVRHPKVRQQPREKQPKSGCTRTGIGSPRRSPRVPISKWCS